VASALNANDQCLAQIAAVHLQMPDLASAAVRDALAAEDSLIKYARDGGAANWNPALHPRTGAPPNPGWFATTGDASHHAPSVSVAENDDPTRRSDAAPDAVDNWVRLPPGKRIDELGDFLEWLANAKPEDEQTIRAEINRYWGSVGDFHAVGTLNYMLSQVLKPGTTRHERQQILDLVDNYSRYDPAEVAQFYDQLFDLFALLGAGRSLRPRANMPSTGEAAPAEAKSPVKAQRRLPVSHWPKPTQPHGNLGGPNEGVISKSDSGARLMRIFQLSTRFPTASQPALNRSTSTQPRIKMPPV
jgi:hypothetical protein